MEMLEIVSDDFVVNCYRAIEQYLSTTGNPNLLLDMLPTVYKAIHNEDFPIPLSIIARGFLDHLFVVTIPATGVMFVENAKLGDTTRAGILNTHRKRLESCRGSTLARPADMSDDKVAKSVQLILRGLHRALELNPIPQTLKQADLESYLRNVFFKVWNIPLLLDDTGFTSITSLVEAFPQVFSVDWSSRRPAPINTPDFTVGKLVYVPQQTEHKPSPVTNGRALTAEQAQMVDNIKSSMALIKVELMECGRDREKYNMLSGRLSIKQKQLEELRNSFSNTITNL